MVATAGRAVPSSSSLRLLADLPGCLLQVVIALLVGPTGTEARSDKCGPCPALEQEHREHHAEAEAEGRLDQEVRQAVIPLGIGRSLR